MKYQALFPKERKGESILLERSRAIVRPAAPLFTPPNTVRAIGDLNEPMLGGDLSYEDIIENFFAWDQQAIAGNEVVDGVSCQILESKPGKGGCCALRPQDGSVRSWIDVKRLVPLRIEKYSASGKLVRRIDTIPAWFPVTKDGKSRRISSHGPHADSSTQLDGSRIRHDVSYTDADFSPEGLKDVAAPHGAP